MVSNRQPLILSIVRSGSTYSGSVFIRAGIVTVVARHGRRSAPLTGAGHLTIAERLLSQLVDEGRA